jgi:hypothetical protein
MCVLYSVMRPIQLRVSDLSKVTGYSRFQIRGLLTEVFRNSPLGRKTGSQQTFSPQELLVVAVACQIEASFGVGRKKLALVGEAMRKTLTGPRGANRDARLLVTFTPPAVTYLESDARIAEGLVLQLGLQFAKVDEYLGVSGPGYESAQTVLALSPAVTIGRRGAGSRRG